MRPEPPILPHADLDGGPPGEPADDFDAKAPLPSPSGPPRAVLMLVHPRLLFLYWVVGPEVEDRIRRAGSPAELRVEASDDGRSFREAPWT